MNTEARIGKPKMYSYASYKEEVVSLYEVGKVSGDKQSEALLQTTFMNLQRMKRLDKKSQLSSEMLVLTKKTTRKMNWYLLIEGWCADGSQNVPIIAQIADAIATVDLKIVFRDENPEIMNQYLTNGGKAIPKLVCFDAVTNNEIGTWGPRPARIQEKVVAYKKQHPEMDKNDFANHLHKWYAKDKAQALQEEFMELLNKWK